MHKLIVMYPYPDDPQQFIEYYEKHHVPLAATLPGLLKQSHGQPKALGGDTTIFLIWEGLFADRDALFAALPRDDSPSGVQGPGDDPTSTPPGLAARQRTPETASPTPFKRRGGHSSPPHS